MFYFFRDFETAVVSQVERGTFMGYDVSVPLWGYAQEFASTFAEGFNMFLNPTEKSRRKSAERFVDGAINLILTSQGLPYNTPKSIIEGPYIMDIKSEAQEKAATKRVKDFLKDIEKSEGINSGRDSTTRNIENQTRGSTSR